nr:hypothetical protein GCM10020093_013300 [Planobispora longispora]
MGAVIGVGEGRGIAFMYIVLGLGIAVHVLVSMRIPVLARFDDEVPEATPDDLVGAQALRERAGNRVSLAWSAPAFAKALTMPLSAEKAGELLGAEVERVVLRTGGEISAVYEVRCADRSLPHPDLIVKIYPDLFTARLHKEMLVYDLLRGSGVPAPAVVKWDDSKRDLPRAYLVMTKMEGRPLSEVSGSLPEAAIAGLYREMGARCAPCTGWSCGSSARSTGCASLPTRPTWAGSSTCGRPSSPSSAAIRTCTPRSWSTSPPAGTCWPAAVRPSCATTTSTSGT